MAKRCISKYFESVDFSPLCQSQTLYFDVDFAIPSMNSFAKSLNTRCINSWRIPLIGFFATYLWGAGNSLNNTDNRIDVQVVGLIVFTALGLCGLYYTIRGGLDYRRTPRKRLLFHLLGGCFINTILISILVFGAHALYGLNHYPASLKQPSLADFQPQRSPNTQLPIWIDTDPACGQGLRDDVDDCWALTAALKSPELNILGVSTVFGNTQGAIAFQVAKQLIQKFGTDDTPTRKPPTVYSGAMAAGTQDWKSTDASEAIAAALHQQKLTLVAIGPLTNIATVIQKHPEVIPQIERLIVIAGKRPGDLFHPGKQMWFHFRDFNVCKDTLATKIILDSGIPLVLAPFELATKLTITRTDLDRLQQGDEGARWLYRNSQGWIAFWERDLHRQGFYPFDVLAIGYLTMPEYFHCTVSPARIGFDFFTEPLGIGRDLEVAQYMSGPSVYYCSNVDRVFKTKLLKRIVGI
jgi:purine nucleosidase